MLSGMTMLHNSVLCGEGGFGVLKEEAGGSRGHCYELMGEAPMSCRC